MNENLGTDRRRGFIRGAIFAAIVDWSAAVDADQIVAMAQASIAGNVANL